MHPSREGKAELELTPYQRSTEPPLKIPNYPRGKAQHSRAARTRAEGELGRLHYKRPGGGYLPSGFPLLGDDQVYVFRTGTVFHPLPCPDVQAGWSHNKRLVDAGRVGRKALSLVVLRQSVGRRHECTRCKSLTEPKEP